jgi:transglutaminase-like putative cysteine protease
MRLSIEHETHYRFGGPAHHSIQYLRLTPRAESCQWVAAWTLTTPGKMRRWTDGFGNIAHVSVQSGVHDDVPVVVRGEVETIDTAGVLPADDGLPPLMFIRPTRFTRVEGGIEELAKPFFERKNDEGPIAALHALMWTLHTTLAYKPGLTDVETTAAEALEKGSGVCQDHAHLFIACARVLGIPARYVSGYLCGANGEHAQRGSLASHAWAEAFVDDLGWVSFDTTNSQSATESYVRLAVAFDYGGAAPIRGIRRGGGIEEMSVRVLVTQRQTQSQSPAQGQSQAQGQNQGQRSGFRNGA